MAVAELRIGLKTLIACAFCCAGCNSVGPSNAHVSLPLLSGRSGAKITAKQSADIHVALGRSLESQGDIDRAMDAYYKAVEMDSDRTDAYVRLAVLHDQRGAFGESAKMYQTALRAEPRNPDTLADLGYSFYLQGRWAEAEKELQQAIDLKENHRRAHNNLGLVFARMNRQQDALTEFRRAGCSQADAHANLAFMLAVNHKWDEARRQYELALAADPTSNAAKTGARELDAIMAKVSPTRSGSHPEDSRALTSGGLEKERGSDSVLQPPTRERGFAAFLSHGNNLVSEQPPFIAFDGQESG